MLLKCFYLNALQFMYEFTAPVLLTDTGCYMQVMQNECKQRVYNSKDKVIRIRRSNFLVCIYG